MRSAEGITVESLLYEKANVLKHLLPGHKHNDKNNPNEKNEKKEAQLKTSKVTNDGNIKQTSEVFLMPHQSLRGPRTL